MPRLFGGDVQNKSTPRSPSRYGPVPICRPLSPHARPGHLASHIRALSCLAPPSQNLELFLQRGAREHGEFGLRVRRASLLPPPGVGTPRHRRRGEYASNAVETRQKNNSSSLSRSQKRSNNARVFNVANLCTSYPEYSPHHSWRRSSMENGTPLTLRTNYQS